MIASYTWNTGNEFVLAFDKGRSARLLIVPALFEEASRMRRLTAEVMRRLDLAGIDCFLPDLPGCNESETPLESVTPDDWRQAMAAAAAQLGATHVLGIRGGALLTPAGMPCWHYAATKGASLLRQMIRARILTAREAGRDETQESLLTEGRQNGIELAGYRLSAAFLRQFETLVPESTDARTIDQDMVSGGGLWLRAEPDEDRAQADALAAVLAIGIAA